MNFTNWPLGTIVLNTVHQSVGRVVAHVEGKWLCTDRPKYDLITEILAPKEPTDYQFVSEDWRSKTVVAGVIPEGRFGGFCTESGCIVRLRDIRHAYLNRNVRSLAWDRPPGFIIQHYDEGDPSVGISGGYLFYSNLGLADYRYPEWTGLPENKILVEVAFKLFQLKTRSKEDYWRAHRFDNWHESGHINLGGNDETCP